jgi:hypothetical protein
MPGPGTLDADFTATQLGGIRSHGLPGMLEIENELRCGHEARRNDQKERSYSIDPVH